MIESKSIFQKIINFIKYHNAFAIGIIIVFVGFSTALAVSPELREDIVDVLVSEEQAVQSIDNNYILSADLDNFDFNLQIKDISEDPKNYYVLYAYQTIAIQDYAWQELEKEKTMTVSKEALGGKDLGIYIAEELGEVIDYELAYLREVQTLETEKGLTQKIVTTQYAGLIGVFLNPKEKVFPGYEPVVKPPEPIAYEPEIEEQIQTEIIQESITEELIDESALEQTETEAIDSFPDTIIDIRPQNTTISTEAIFTFHATKENCEFTCKIDSEFWQGCSSSITYTDLFIGNHQFHVQAIDSTNQEDPIPAMFEWQIIGIQTTSTDETATSTDSAGSPQADETIVSEDETTTSTDEIATSTPECQSQLFYLDSDNDGYGDLNNTTSTCEQVDGYVVDSADCNDSDPNINPAAVEVCDNIDNNCNEEIDEDCDCGITSCDVGKLTVECQNTCIDGVCQSCVPTCVCSDGFYDCDNDNTCETQEECSTVE